MGTLEDSDSEGDERYRRYLQTRNHHYDHDHDHEMPGLVTTGTSGSESDDDEDDDEETPSMYCLTCQGICGCPINISSSSDEPLVVGEASIPSSALRRGKKKLEHLLDLNWD